jgi:hypothetical protein
MPASPELVETTTQDEEPKPKVGPEAVKLWHERISIALKVAEEWARKEGPERITQEYLGKFDMFFNGLKRNIPVAPINEIYAYVQSDLSHTYNRDPYISVNPKSGTVLGARLWEVIINYYWRHLNLKDEVEIEIIDKDLTGSGFHKVGWNVESKGAEEELKIIQESLYSKRVDWKDIIWNLGAEKVPDDCLWMAQRIVKPLEVIKKKYKNAKTLKGVRPPELAKDAYDKSSYKDDISVAIIWEVWDKETRQVYLVAEGLRDKYLDKPKPWPEYMDDFPFLMYWDTYAPGKRRPMSPILPWEPQVHEKMIIMAATVNHAKRWNRQMLVKKGAISNNDLDKIERGDDGAIIDYTGSGDLDKNIKFIDWGSFPVDYVAVMDRLSAIERDTNGQPEFERGGVTKTATRTEGELQMIQAGAKGRQDRKIDRFETHLENIASQMMAHLKANFDFEETVRITGETPQDVLEALGDHLDQENGTVKFTPQDIEGDYEVEIKSGSTLPLNKETKQQILQLVLGVIAKVSGLPLPPTLRAIITEMLADYDIKSLEEAFKQEMQASDQVAAQKSQQGNAVDLKAKTQSIKNVMQSKKVGAETEQQQLENALTIDLIRHKLLDEKTQGRFASLGVGGGEVPAANGNAPEVEAPAL